VAREQNARIDQARHLAIRKNVRARMRYSAIDIGRRHEMRVHRQFLDHGLTLPTPQPSAVSTISLIGASFIERSAGHVRIVPRTARPRMACVSRLRGRFRGNRRPRCRLRPENFGAFGGAVGALGSLPAGASCASRRICGRGLWWLARARSSARIDPLTPARVLASASANSP